MYSIGRFASIGRVTVRMLRHWDEIGLLPPAHVDPVTGYRSYAPAQLDDLALVVRLRDLGCGLEAIGRIRRDGVDAPSSRRLLQSVRDELRRSIDADTARLARFDAYLLGTEGTTMSTTPIEVRDVPAQRVATFTRTAGGFGSRNIGPVVGPMFPEAEALLVSAGVPFGPAVATYTADDSGDGSSVLVTAGFVLEDDSATVAGLDVHVLPAARALVATHHGSMATIDESWHALMDAAEQQGAVLSDSAREVYLTEGDVPQEQWVTELIQPIAPTAG